jgi:hypothetical protein
MIFTELEGTTILTRQARCIGAKAKSLVSVPGFSGRVLAALSDVAYLSGRDGEILWLFRKGMALHGRGILLPFPLQGLHASQEFWVEGHNLIIGRGLVVDLRQAVEWMHDPLSQWELGPFVRVNDLVRQLLGTITLGISDDGPGQVILGLSSILDGSNEPAFLPEPWQIPILSPVFGLMAHCLDEGLSEIESRGRDLIGLGPGLTPCGDDFLGGLLFTAHWLQGAFPGKLHLETKSVLGLVQWARDRTHPISHAILGDLAIGQGPEPLHNLLRLLLKGEDLDGRTMDAIDCLVKVGHTTGWWILSGVLTCLLSVDEMQDERMTHGSSWVKGEPVWPRGAVAN